MKNEETALLKSKETTLLTYGLTLEDYNQMIVDQKGLCAICGNPETHKIKGVTKSLAVDHNHLTGKVRALLCSNCNTALGLFRDNPELLITAASYLLKHK